MKLNTQTLLLKAKKLLKKGEIKEAQQIYLSILEAFPKNVQAHNSLKELDKKVTKVKHKSLSRAQLDSVINLINSGQIKQAIGSINPLIQKYPNAPILYNLSGICLNSISHFEDAIKMLLTKLPVAITPWPSLNKSGKIPINSTGMSFSVSVTTN